jgi:erythronate-4-phosphate dehydrogenase
MKIVADANIPLIREAIGTLGDVALIPGREITRQALQNADALFVRSITKVDENLLEGTHVRLVATATIGVDHVDTAWLQKKGIGFASAPGSNARSVAEYIATAIVKNSARFDRPLESLTIGIVGVGNVGIRVHSAAQALGMRCMLNDPPRQRAGDPGDFCNLGDLLKNSDIVTLHVPLALDGPDMTAHLADAKFFERMKSGAMFINASRGAVVDESALRTFRAKIGPVVLDVWDNEPTIDLETLAIVDSATPHIAGYSFDGKLNGTQMVYTSFCEFVGIKPENDVRKSIDNEIRHLEIDDAGDELGKIITQAYAIDEDDRALRRLSEIDPGGRGNYFDALRKNYPRRLEFKHFKVTGSLRNHDRLQRLGFHM